jgi:hypothetical protein
MGVPEVLLFGMIFSPFIGAIVVAFALRRRAKRFGYASTMAYLRAVPQSDAEKRDAADLAVMGLVICLLGLFLRPLVLVGLIPFFYGARKFAYASLGLGLVDDGDQSGL